MLIDQADIDRAALRGKVAVVTGAGRGIGRETARALARLGAAVVIAEIDPLGTEVESAIRADGGQALFVQSDIADPAGVDALHRQTRAAFGPAHILINNAEAFAAKPLLAHTLDEWDRVFAVNLRGAFLCIRAFLPEMLEQRDGVIVTMSSSDGMPFLSAYLASKVGLSSLARSLAAEVGEASGVSVYCCGPGMVDTPGLRAAIPLLAPLYGVSPEEFIRQSAPGGELWPAEAAATGLVGSVLHARQFHGQDIDSFVGLQQLGLDVRGKRFNPDQTLEDSQDQILKVSQDQTLRVSETLRVSNSVALNRALEAMLRDNIREYDELSMFQRPIVKRMFQQGTGLKVEEWLAAAQKMTAALESDGADLAAREVYRAQLKRLAAFLVKQESDARGYFKEPERLEAALEALHARQAIVQSLATALVDGA